MDYRKKVIINTLAQHTRAILNTGMSLYSTRYILSALGNSDFGIFALIGSTVTMLGFITNAMVITTQRHLSFSYGENNIQNTQKIYSNSLFIHILIGLVLSTILLSVKPLLFNGFLEIEASRMNVAANVYVVMIFILFITFITSPFRALFIARENIIYISIIDFLDGAFRLALAIMLLHVEYDRLMTYSLMMAGIATFNLMAFVIYAKKKFEEAIIIPRPADINIKSIKEIIGFAGWTIYSTGCIIGRTQGIPVLLNKFFGTIINTSYGIAAQVAGAVQFIAQAVLNAMSPQIIKAEGAKERKRMLYLAELTSKYAFLLLSMAVVPLTFEMPTILNLWLGDVPENTVMFCRFILFATVIDQTTIGLGTANQAIGKIRTFSIIIYTMKIMTLPFAYFCLKLGLPVVSTMWCYVITETICAIIRLPFLKYTAGLSISEYINNIFFRIIPPIISLIITGWLITTFCDFQFRIIITIILSIIVDIIVIGMFSMTKAEKEVIMNIMRHRDRG